MTDTTKTGAGGMSAARALALLDALRAAGIDARVDGGWGVDALLGRQTRPHDDLDLVVGLADVPRIEVCLAAHGYAISLDALPVRFVMQRAEGGQIDFHTVRWDAGGGGVQPQPGGGSFRYPPEGFVVGRIADREVGCISAQIQILCHLGYPPTAKDAGDVLRLCAHFDLPVPAPYAPFAEDG